MAKLKKTIVTKTVTEKIEMTPTAAGEERGHRFMTVGGYGEYKSTGGSKVLKPQINLNVKWLAEAGFNVGEKIDVEVRENELVIRRLAVAGA